MDDSITPSDPKKLFKALSATEQLREALYNAMLDITEKKYLALNSNAFNALHDYLVQNKPDPKTAPWQQTIIYQMAVYVNADLQLEVERRHGVIINPDLNNNG